MRKKIEKIKNSVLGKGHQYRLVDSNEEYREINNVSFQQNFHNLIGHFKGENFTSRTFVNLADTKAV